MFEYLMPPLFLRSLPGTLLAESARGAVLQQIAYGKIEGVPWGISESGFYHFDANQNYQYRAFGVPGLGFKRGLADDLVIAPYASLMARRLRAARGGRQPRDDHAATCSGSYGFYESIDFTPTRMPLDQKSAMVGEYMAHHQGMILLALVNYFARRYHGPAHAQPIRAFRASSYCSCTSRCPGVRRLRTRPPEDVNGRTAPGDRAGAASLPGRCPCRPPCRRCTCCRNGATACCFPMAGAASAAGKMWT